MADVAIVGAGQTVFSRSCGVSIRELAFDAFKEALEGLDITTMISTLPLSVPRRSMISSAHQPA